MAAGAEYQPSTRLEALFDLNGGALLHPCLRRLIEGRALAALEPVAAPLSVLVRRWAWPMPRRWGSLGSGPGQFNCPHGLAVSSAGEVFVCDMENHRVQVFGLDGSFRLTWGSQGDAPGLFFYPHGVVVCAAGGVLVSDRTRVQVFASDGSFVRCLHLPAGAADEDDDDNGAFEPWGVAVTPSGDVVVCGNHAVFIEPAGA